MDFRPKILKEFIGQDSLKKNLSIFISSALKRKKPLDHTILYGPPGTGKTSLAGIISNEMCSQIKSIQGPHLQKIPDVLGVLTNLSKGDTIFIDEIHAMSRECSEILYSAMEDFTIDIKIGKEMNSKSVRIKTPEFTLVGATTDIGLIDNPLYDRFGIEFKINHYSSEELAKIVSVNAKKKKINISDSASFRIAQNSKRTPRIANKILKRIIDYASYKEKNEIDDRFVKATLKKLGYYPMGLKKIDMDYLSLLETRNSGTGLEYIALNLYESKKTIEEKIESHLMHLGLIQRTSRGRVISQEGKQYLEKNTRA